MTDDTIRDQHDHTQDEPSAAGIKRRNVLTCMAWAGTGLSGLLLAGCSRHGRSAGPRCAVPVRDHFVQISDTHIGFKGAAKLDVMGIGCNRLSPRSMRSNRRRPFSSTPGTPPIARRWRLDTLAEGLKDLKSRQVFYAPGEHDVFADGGREFPQPLRVTTGKGWQSFDYQGCILLAGQRLEFQDGGPGQSLGQGQLDWLKTTGTAVQHTPIVVLYPYPPSGLCTPPGDGSPRMASRPWPC